MYMQAFFCNVIGWLFVYFFALCLFLLTDFFSLLIFAHCLFWPFRFFHPAWTLFWTAFFCTTLKFPRIYDQPYFHSKKTIGCSQTKLSTAESRLLTTYSVQRNGGKQSLSDVQSYLQRDQVPLNFLSTKISLKCIFYHADLFTVLASLFEIENWQAFLVAHEKRYCKLSISLISAATFARSCLH